MFSWHFRGNQESITFYHHNGSSVDLSGIHSPLLTNVTAQSMIGVAPVQGANQTRTVVPWSALEKLASLQQPKAPGNFMSAISCSSSIRFTFCKV